MSDLISKGLGELHLDSDVTGNAHGCTTDLQSTIQELLERGRLLHGEVEQYIAAVIEKQGTNKVQNPVEYRNLRNDMKNELSFLQKIAGSSMDEEKIRHCIVSSNLMYYEALWSAAKRSSGLQSFRKNFFWDRQTAQAGKHISMRPSLAKGSHAKVKAAALVDIVAEEGTEWIRVSTASEKRLLFDLAKLGWVNDPDSDDDMPDARHENWEDDDDDDQVDVVKNARELVRAARANPIRGHPPRIRFVLTRIVAGKTQAIDTVVNKIRATGAIVECVDDIPSPVPLQTVLSQLLLDRSRTLSDTLNIDCTILLALISDISHRNCPILDWYPGEVRAQINEEANDHLLLTHLYPAIGARSMICTKEAVDQMNLIVQTLATDTEKLRADLLLGQGSRTQQSPAELAAEWSANSDHKVPEGFRLPIRSVTVDMENVLAALPSAAIQVAAELGHLNTSIFLCGWAKGFSTLSANRGRARQIDSIINEVGLADGETGPHIWLCGESRSLIAKHGRRR